MDAVVDDELKAELKVFEKKILCPSGWLPRILSISTHEMCDFKVSAYYTPSQLNSWRRLSE